MRVYSEMKRFIKKQHQPSVRYYTKVCNDSISEAFYFHPEWKNPSNRKDIDKIIRKIRLHYSPYFGVEYVSDLAQIIWDVATSDLKSRMIKGLNRENN